VVLENCVRSIMATSYPRTEVIVVDDGSSDDTPAVMAALGREFPQVRMLHQANAGKGAALNHGAAVSSGEVLVFVDADSLFQEDTLQRMLEGFDDENVGAVCGDDRPVNLDRVLTRLLTVISHIGTGLVRRSLSLLGCLPIVSGNSGAFRREVFAEVGGFDEDTVGEDLELTWRVHRAGRQVRFAPRALVLAESPSTVLGLWKQRVRWARGLLETTVRRAGMIGNPRYGVFGAYLLFNTVTMIVMPGLQLLVLVLLPVLALGGENHLPTTAWAWIGWLGLLLTLAIGLIAISLNRAWADLRHLWTLPLWPLYSVFVSFTMVRAIWLQAARRPSTWNKLERTGVVGLERPASPAAVGGAVGAGVGTGAGVGDLEQPVPARSTATA
jgi:cellulose synthase/poly-beta-1,6-N-acetylglucosamine synthase-like glycosyltransferase